MKFRKEVAMKTIALLAVFLMNTGIHSPPRPTEANPSVLPCNPKLDPGCNNRVAPCDPKKDPGCKN